MRALLQSRALLVALSMLLVVAFTWAHIARRERVALSARRTHRNPFLQASAPVPCPTMRGLMSTGAIWLDDSAVREAGWQPPPHMRTMPKDRTSAALTSTPRGWLVWVQADGGGGDVGYPHWLALLAGGQFDEHHPPPVAHERSDVFAYSPSFFPLGQGFLMVSGAEGGVLEKLDAHLATVRKRTQVAPRQGTPSIGYVLDDGAGGVYLASYGDTGVRVHHVDANLDDVVPSRFFTVPETTGGHWNPRAFGLTSDRVCVELACFRPTSGMSEDCGSRRLVLDHALEPAETDPAPVNDPVPAKVAWLALTAVVALLAALVLVARALRGSRSLGPSPVEAEILETNATGIVLRSNDEARAVPSEDLRPVFGRLMKGPCVIPGAFPASTTYRGRDAGGTSARLPIAAGTLREVTTRTGRAMSVTLFATVGIETALVVTALLAR